MATEVIKDVNVLFHSEADAHAQILCIGMETHVCKQVCISTT